MSLPIILLLLTGEQTIETCLTLHPLTTHSSQDSDQSSFIEVDLKVSTEKSLLSEDDRDHGWACKQLTEFYGEFYFYIGTYSF